MRQGLRTKRCLSAPSLHLPFHGVLYPSPPEAPGSAARIEMLITNMLGVGERASFRWTYKNTALGSGRRETWRSAHLCSDTQVWGPQRRGTWGVEERSLGLAVRAQGYKFWLCHLLAATQDLSLYQLYKMRMRQPRHIMGTDCTHVTWHILGVSSISLSAYFTNTEHVCAWHCYKYFII